MIHFEITPDLRIDNKNVERLVQGFSGYKNMFSRWNGKGFDPHSFFSFETVLKRDGTKFFLTVDDNSEPLAAKLIESTWKRAAREKVSDPFTKKPAYVSHIEYARHYMFAIKVDRRTNGYLDSLLETVNAMTDEDEIYIQTLALPASLDWHRGAVEANKRLRQGMMPQKTLLTKEGVTKAVVTAAAKTMIGIVDTINVATGGEKQNIDFHEHERAELMRNGELRRETIQKTRGEGFEVYIRVAVVCDDRRRAEALKRMVTVSFNDLEGDNKYVEVNKNPSKAHRAILSRDRGIQTQKDYHSTQELARLVLMPTGRLQEDYRVSSIRRLETEISPTLIKGGMLLGYHDMKGKQSEVYFPISNYDELCLPSVAIGGMGQGKTKGYGANKIVEAVKNGFGALCLDPAKGEMGDEIEKSLPADKVIRFNLGETPIAIDWRETEHAVRGRNRLANTIISFFDDDDTGGQTTRFLRASVFGMRTTNIKELLRMFEDAEYLKKSIGYMPDSIHKTTLQNLLDYSDGRRRQILDPLYNRLDDIMGDEYLAECFDAKEGIDLVDIMKQRKAVIIDIPKRLVGETGVNLIGNLIMTKIDLAMTLREESEQFPFFVIIDEPHQFTRSKKVWKNACVESRKWRVGYNFMFHEWLQLDRELRDIIRSAGANYHLYPSSKKIFANLAEEIAPFTIEDALNMKTHHAINLIRCGGEQIKPFVLRMTPPPSMRLTP